jgi:hypothetical protein
MTFKVLKESRDRPFGLTLFAVLIGLSSIAQLGRISEGPPAHVGFVLIAYSTLVAGLVAATELWRVRRKALLAYIAWVLFILIRAGMKASLVESAAALETGMEIVIVGIIPAIVYFYLRSEFNRMDALS